MDLKADDKDWTHNIQQKFDVVRQEVDEFVSMDTLKYVENQVQTLGETVKGFCSNILQDFLPPDLSIPVNHDAGTVPQEGKFVTETYKKSVTNLKEKYVDANTKLLPSALSNPVNHDADPVPPKVKFVMEIYEKSVTNLKEKCVDTNTKLLSSALSNPVNGDAESVLQKGKFETETYKKSANNLKEKYVDTMSNPVNHDAGSVTYKKSATDRKEKYVDTNTKLLLSALSNPVNHDAESVPKKEKHAAQNSNKPLIIIKEKYADIASERISIKQDFGHHVPTLYRRKNAKQTIPMPLPLPLPTKGDKKITKALFPLARDESPMVHDNVKTSVVGYIGLEFEGLVAKEKSLPDSNSIGINDETSLVFVTEDDYHDQDITDEAVSAFTGLDKAVDDTYKKSATDLKEKYVDTNPSALSNPVNHDAESVPQKDKHATQNYNKPLIIIKEKYADIASERISKKQDFGHRVPIFYRHKNAKQPMPMPTKGDKKITKAVFPLARDESPLVHDNVKTSVVGYTDSEFEGLVGKEKSLSDSNSIGINDKTSLIFVTEDDYHNQDVTDEVVSAAVDSLRVCSSFKERTCDTFFDDCHCDIIGTSQASEVECSFSHGCQVVEPTLISSTSSLSNGSYTIPHETENFVYDLTDSVGTVPETPGHADESKIDILDPNMKTIDLSENSKLNESCVIVDNIFLGATSCRPRRHRSYKQMIKDAYTKTKRLTKEYEVLGILYGDIDNEAVEHEKHSSRLPSVSETTPGNKQSLTEDLSDCDWELV